MFYRLIIILIVGLALFGCEKSTDPKLTVPTPTFYPHVGPSTTFSSPQNVEIRVSVTNASIYYTLDGSEPNTGSLLYTAPIAVNGLTTIKARGYKNKMKPSAVGTATYVFNVGAIYISPGGGTYTTPQTVTLTAVTPGTEIRYSTDGTEPTESSILYTAPILVDGNSQLRVKGFISGWNPSSTFSANYTLNTTIPSLSHQEGTYYTPFNLIITTTTPGGEIRYTTDGSEPTETSALYTSALNISMSASIKAKTFKNNWNTSGTVSANYTLKVVAPAFSPLPGVFPAPQNVTISCTTADVELFYTTDGSEPTMSSTPYTTSVYLKSNAILKARAFKTGWTGSNITQGNYYFTVSAPVFDPPAGNYNGAQSIILTCTTPDAEIRYTTNNTEPTTSSTLFTDPINVVQSMTIKAKAFKTGMSPSTTTSATYFIINSVATPEFDPPAGIYYEPQTVSITCETPNADIRYTLDNTEPTINSTMYTAPINVTSYSIIKAKGFRANWNPSAIATAVYHFDTYDNIVAWGTNNYNQCNVPIGTDFLAMDAGMYHSVAIRSDGSLVAWGRNNNGQCNFPAGNNFVAVSAGDNHSVALRSDGTIVAWGLNADDQCVVPDDSLNYTYISIAAGGNHTLALLADSSLVAWGRNAQGQCNVPTGNDFVRISAGGAHNLVLRANGSMVAWGSNDSGQLNVPTGTNYVEIAAGDQHNVARRSTGSLVAWGNNTNGQCTVPSGTDFAKVSAGYRHSLALKQNGTIITWGFSGSGLGNTPTVNTFIGVSAGRDFSLAIKPATDSRGRKLKLTLPKVKARMK